ncbi:TetR/AcrR family transcriptional regulator [Nocardia inohanensis]|uniref:TetR/AcrR family transcriptional regulator n=1 Tax=Nocardia inohanensis TaxID=209246 RepID=UPI001C3FA29C|nr:TetR/AcrR family transcriptional regulator [Nocardia inohanensis]
MSSPDPAPRRARADASRNRDRILEAARILFAERGSQVQLPEVARAAGVGIGTVYRHFPAQSDLIEAAAEQRFAEIESFARGDCLRAAPGQAVLTYLAHVGELLSADRGLSAAIEAVRDSTSSAPRGASLSRLTDAIAELIESDRAAGALRPDLTPGDVYMLVGAISATVRTGSGDWRRLLELVRTGVSGPQRGDES